VSSAPAPAAWLPPGDERATRASSERLMAGAGGRALDSSRAARVLHSKRDGARYNPCSMVSTPDPELFREVFGYFATGVAVITSAGPGGAGGMTANALCSLSLDPLLALVCFQEGARTLPIVREAGRFGVNVLAAQQEHLAGVFASKVPEEEKLESVEHTFEHGVPIISGALAWAVCSLRDLIAGGDHTIAVGEVIAMGHSAGEPLIWYRGGYRSLTC